MILVLNSIILFVNDTDKLKHFYVDKLQLGLLPKTQLKKARYLYSQIEKYSIVEI